MNGYFPSPSSPEEVVPVQEMDYTRMFIQYDDTGQVHYVANTFNPEFRNFAIEISLIEDFMAGGKKNPRNYSIEYFFNISKGIIETEQEQEIVQNNLPYIIPRTTSFSNEITLVHNKDKKYWEVFVRSDVTDRLEISSTLVFFICKKDNLNFLYTNFTINPTELIAGPVKVPFKLEKEFDLEDISVVTKKQFKSYGIKEEK